MTRRPQRRAPFGVTRAAVRGAAASVAAMQQTIDAVAARGGVLGPGSSVPRNLSGYYDFRGTASPRELPRDVRLMSGLLSVAHESGRPVTGSELLSAAHDRYALEQYVGAYGTPRARMLLHDALTSDLFDYPKVMSGVVNALDPLAIPQIDA